MSGIAYKKVNESFLPKYDSIQMSVNVTSCFHIDKINRGLGGFTITEKAVEPHVKDFRTDHGTSLTHDAEQFDTTNWAFFMAFDGDLPIGGAAIASRTKEINMLSGREDLALLWDIRVDGAYKGKGVAQKLFDMAVDWSSSQGLVQMKIECQNNNVPACKFYHKQGAVLSEIDEYAYYNEPQYRHEVMFVWFLDL